MPYELFWHGKPSLYYNYLDAYNQKLKEQYEASINQANFVSWLTGFYTCRAIEVHNPYVKKKHEYPSEPIKLSEKQSNEEDSTKQQEQLAIAQFMAFGELAKVFNKNRKENGK